jgi:hypothetical protein
MIFFEVKLINPETKEIYFKKIGKKPELPDQSILDKYLGALIIIDTKNSLLEEAMPSDSAKNIAA